MSVSVPIQDGALLQDPSLDKAYQDWATSILFLFEYLQAPAPSLESLALALDDELQMQELYDYLHITVEHFCQTPEQATQTQLHLDAIRNATLFLQQLYQQRRRSNWQQLKHHQAYLVSEALGSQNP